ncbi:MAG: exonuclease SbcCD subunit D [Bacteroidota bacterium]
MKILHTADWHLGKKLEHFSRLEEQREVLDEICQIADDENVDAVLIAGDLFDVANPSIDSIELFYKTLKRLAKHGQRAVIGIAGNHDSPDRIEAPDPLARECGIILLGYPNSTIRPFSLDNGIAITRSDEGFVEVKLPNQETLLRVILTPYANENRLKKYLGDANQEQALRELLQDKWKNTANTYFDENGVNILMTHLFVTPSGDIDEDLEDEEEKSVLSLGGAQAIHTQNFPSSCQYVALGHIHSYYAVQEDPFPIVYSSSPLCYSVSDRQKEKHVVLVDIEAGKQARYQKIPLTKGKKTAQVKCQGMEEALSYLQDNPNKLIELTLVTDHHLTASERKQLFDSHQGILRIIPEFSDPELLKFTSGKQIDLSKDMMDIFSDFFMYRKNQEINEELKSLFKEIINEKVEE